MSFRTSSLSGKVQFAVISAAALVASAYGHGRVIEAGFVNTDNGVTAGGANDPCGTSGTDTWSKYIDIYGAPRYLSLDAEETWNWQLNAADGGGPLTAAMDTTCRGKTFDTPLTVVTNVPGTDGIASQPIGTKFPLKIKMPSKLSCNCPGNTCLMRFINPKDFTSCRYVKFNQVEAPAAAAPQQRQQQNYYPYYNGYSRNPVQEYYPRSQYY